MRLMRCSAMDNIDRIMKEADRLGFGVSYGKYRAAYPDGSAGVLPKQLPKAPEKKTCLCRLCKKPFVPPHGSRRYCSPECRAEAVVIRHRESWRTEHKTSEHRKPVMVCAICGADFAPDDLRKKYCCEECRLEGRRIRQRNWDRSHKRKRG